MLKQLISIYYCKNVTRFYQCGHSLGVLFDDNTSTVVSKEAYKSVINATNLTRVVYRYSNSTVKVSHVKKFTVKYDSLFNSVYVKVHFKYQGSFVVTISELFDEFIESRNSRPTTLLGIDQQQQTATYLGSRGERYHLSYDGDNNPTSCTCPDHNKTHLPCKHMLDLANQLETLFVNQVLSDAYMVEQLADEHDLYESAGRW